jgi:glycerol-3-phosphate acyltransferase PlsY
VIFAVVATAALAYVVGSLPTGVLLARLANVDVRRAGSGNIGATNVARTAGSKLGLLTLVLDAAKGAVPVLVAGGLAGAAGRTPAEVEALRLTAGLAALIGHVFSLFLGFKGGKGVATALGAIVALAPLAALAAIVLFAAVFAVTRWVSLGSIVAAAGTPIVAAFAGYPVGLTATLTAMAIVILLRHRDNIARLIAGNEPRFSPGSGGRSKVRP